RRVRRAPRRAGSPGCCGRPRPRRRLRRRPRRRAPGRRVPPGPAGLPHRCCAGDRQAAPRPGRRV
ncbi:MAG: hypothetical protein AVDCRST_MAG48-303, partial [uncultured Friedmanniella sp.]